MNAHIYILVGLIGCAACGPRGADAKMTATVAGYAAELTRCREQAKAHTGKLAEYEECAKDVDAKYKVKP